MGFADAWSRTLVYFGIAEEEGWEEDGPVSDEGARFERRRQRQNVRRLPAAEPDAWSDAPAGPEPATPLPFRRPRLRGLESPAEPTPAQVRVHLVMPRAFNDAQQIADRFKAEMPVIVNLQGADDELTRRMIDFASGLTYALDGSIQRVADRVFLLTPRDVELSAEDRARVLDPSPFFNQA